MTKNWTPKSLFVQVLTFHALSTLLCVGVSLLVFAPRQMPGVLLGTAVILSNFLVVIWAWRQIFLKKSIAIAGSVIVFKYPILAVVIYVCLVSWSIDISGFLLGLSSILPTVLLFAVSEAYKKP